MKGGITPRRLATALALPTFLVFLVDQIQRRCRQIFRQLWPGLGARAKLWETLSSVFRASNFPTMESLFRQIAFLYRLQPK
jgi:hypothetical protein